VDEFQKSVSGVSAQDLMNLVLLTQYFYTLKEIGFSSRTNTILIPHAPGALMDLSNQIREAMIVSGQIQPPGESRGTESTPRPERGQT